MSPNRPGPTRRDRASTRADEELGHYPHGYEAPLVATARAVDRLGEAETVIVVEGISDQIAVETLARRLGRSLTEENTLVLPVGGAQAMALHLRELGPRGQDKNLRGLCDRGEVDVVAEALGRAGFVRPSTEAELTDLGFFVCIDDLEDELIRAHGVAGIETVLADHGELKSFRTLQKQPAWRDRPVDQQLRRFFASTSRRKLRYAKALVETAEPNRIPVPLLEVLQVDAGNVRTVPS